MGQLDDREEKMSEDEKKLIAYSVYGTDPLIRPAETTRQWMDETPQSFAYRCLPLNIANMHGWEILCPADFDAVWDGTHAHDGVHIHTDAPPHLKPMSHFGSGILTFHVHALFKTPPGHNLFVTGPLNMPKDGIFGLSGIIETDWSPYTFTMNWRFTTKNKVVSFKKDEPICCFFPIPRGYLESFDPVILPLSEDPSLKANYDAWSISRNEFNKDLSVQGSDAQAEKWQKNYYRGYMPSGKEGPPDHQIKLRLRPFKKGEGIA